MKPKIPLRVIATAFVTMSFSSTVHAQWAGAGVSAGTGGSDLSLPANWNTAANGNFSTINQSGNYNFTLSGNASFAALNFGAALNANTTTAGTFTTATNGGTGYTAAPTVAISGGSGSGATATAAYGSGSVTSTTITSPGSGYFSAGGLPTYVFTGTSTTAATRAFTGALPGGSTNITIGSDTPNAIRTIALGGNITLQGRSDSSVTLTQDITLEISADRSITGGTGGVLNSATVLTINGNVTSVGASRRLSNTGSVVNFGANGIVNLSGGFSSTASAAVSTFAGAVTGPGNVAVTNGTVNLNGTFDSSGGLTISTGTINVNGTFSGSGGITGTAAGTTNLNNADNTFNGNIALSGGAVLGFRSNGALGAEKSISLNGANLVYTGTTDLIFSRALTVSGTSAFRNNGTAAVDVRSAVTFTDAGAFRLGGSYSGGVNRYSAVIASADTGRSVVIGGTGGDSAIWRLTADNTFAGPIEVARATLEFEKLSNLGVGTGTLNLSTANSSTFRYVGVGDIAIDRAVAYGAAVSTTTITNNGWGALTFGGSSFNASDALVGKTLQLSGISTDNNRITSNILRGVDGTGAGSSFSKAGAGTWTLSGANTIGASGAGAAGTITVNNGRLIFDYATNDVWSVASNLTLGGGSFEILARGGAGNNTTETLGALSLATNSGLSRIVVDRNGSDGATLALGDITRNNGTALLVDVSSGGAVTTTAATNATTGLFTNPGHLFVKYDNSPTGFDYMTKDGTGKIIALSASTDLPASGGSTSTNYRLSGSQTLTAATAIASLRVDTTNGGTLDIGSFFLQTPNGPLFVGSGDYTVTGTTGYMGTFTSGSTTSTSVISHFGSGTLNLEAKLGSGAGTVFLLNGSTGLINWKSASNTTSGHQFLGGVIRVGDSNINYTNATTGNGSGNIRIATGGILELQGDLTRNLGSGSGQVDFVGNSGLSAFGAARNVTLNGGAGLSWGVGDFVSETFILGSDFSDSTLNFTNDINLTTLSRVVETRAGVNANVDGRLSGVISSTGGGLVKTGTGKLELTGSNTYTGETWIQQGELVVNNTAGSGTGTGNVRLFSSSTTLSGHGTISGTVSGSGTIAPGNSPGILTVGSVNGSEGLSFLFEMTALNPTYGVPSASGNDVLRITSTTPFTTALTAGNVITVDFTGMSLNIGDVIYGGLFATTDFSASIAGAQFNYLGLNGLQANVSVAQQTANFADGTVNGWETRFQIVPEPSTAVLAGLALGGLLVRRRRD